MNNKHIEIAKTDPYNGTYKRRHSLRSRLILKGGIPVNVITGSGCCCLLSRCGAGADSMSRYFLIGAGRAGR